MLYNYYLQTGKYESLRRYLQGQDTGERWDKEKAQWTKECAPRDTCLQTNDRVLSDIEAEAFVMNP